MTANVGSAPEGPKSSGEVNLVVAALPRAVVDEDPEADKAPGQEDGQWPRPLGEVSAGLALEGARQPAMQGLSVGFLSNMPVQDFVPRFDPDAPLPEEKVSTAAQEGGATGSPAAPADGEAAASQRGPLPRRQLVFFVRHAQSRWNKAQEELALLNLVRENDHGLSEEGREQAEELRERIARARARVEDCHEREARWHRRLLAPNAVFSSPFTRTVCTAAIGLRDLLPEGRHLVLLREAREQKNIGGADSTGIAVGDAIPVRVREDMEQIYQECPEPNRERALSELDAIEMDWRGCEDEWWGAYTGDPADLIDERIAELVERLRETRGDLPGGGGTSYVVGHSLFFRTLFRTFLREPEDLWNTHEDSHVRTALSLTTHVLPFCGVVGCLFEWDQEGKASIVEAVPFLHTSLRAAEGQLEPIRTAKSWPPQPRQGAYTAAFPGCCTSRKETLPAGCVVS